MKPSSRHRKRVTFLCLFFIGIFAVLSISILIKLQAVNVGDDGSYFIVSEREIIVLRYVHSMYGVPVQEKFRVEDGNLVLFHVVTSDAALEYFGIEGKREKNVVRIVNEFTIPSGSVGRHRLYIKDKEIELENYYGKNKNVHIRLVRKPLLLCLTHYLWR